MTISEKLRHCGKMLWKLRERQVSANRIARAERAYDAAKLRSKGEGA